MLPKILVTTGCSYGLFKNAFPAGKEFENHTKNLEIILDLHVISMGSNYQMISIIETIDELLSIGVNECDIFVLCEFSEILRKDIVIQNEFLVNEIDNITIDNIKSVYYPDYSIQKYSDFSKKVLEGLQINNTILYDYAKIKNYYIVNAEKSHGSIIPNKTIQTILNGYTNSRNIDIQLETHHSIDKINIESIDRAIQYFQNILTTEQYLKSKGIKYKFCLINNQFSMFSESGLQTNKESKIINKEHYLFQDYINSKQIWEINSMVKILYDMIDWTNWWFYENNEKNIIWGGIDEFAIDKYGISGYEDIQNPNNLFGQHPTTQVYQDLIVNHLMKEYF